MNRRRFPWFLLGVLSFYLAVPLLDLVIAWL